MNSSSAPTLNGQDVLKRLFELQQVQVKVLLVSGKLIDLLREDSDITLLVVL